MKRTLAPLSAASPLLSLSHFAPSVHTVWLVLLQLKPEPKRTEFRGFAPFCVPARNSDRRDGLRERPPFLLLICKAMC